MSEFSEIIERYQNSREVNYGKSKNTAEVDPAQLQQAVENALQGNIDSKIATSVKTELGKPWEQDADAAGHQVKRLGTPTQDDHAATRKYADDKYADALSQAKTHAQDKSDAALREAKQYTDQRISSIPQGGGGGGGGPAPDLTPYMKKDGSTAFTGNVSADGHRITDLGEVSAAGDATSKTYVDGKVAAAVQEAKQYTDGKQPAAPDLSAYLKHDGSVALTNSLDANGNKVLRLGNPSTGSDAANKLYVDTQTADVLQQAKTYTDGKALGGGGQAPDLSAYMKRDGTTKFAADADLDGHRVVKVGSAVDNLDAANKKYVDDKADDALTQAKRYTDGKVQAGGGGGGTPQPVTTNTVVPASTGVVSPLLGKPLALHTAPENPVVQVPAPPTFTQGVAIAAPYYGTPIVRVTKNKEEIAAGRKAIRSDYSRRQAFNADGTRMIMNRKDGYWCLFDADTLQQVGDVLPGFAGDCEPIWHPTDPNIIWYLPMNGVGMKLFEMDIRTRTSKTTELGPRLKAIWPEAEICWSKSEGSPSIDGRYWCWQVERSNFTMLGVVVYDRVEDKIIGNLSFDADDKPDHTSMSPSGEYATVSWAYKDHLGTRAYTRDLKTRHPAATTDVPYIIMHIKSEHSDLALLPNGDDAYVFGDYTPGQGKLAMVNMRTGKRTDLLDMYGGGTATAYHISTRCYKTPGFAVLSTYSEYKSDPESGNLRNKADMQWFHRKVFVVSLEETPRFWPLAFADSDRLKEWGEAGYWAEPQATVNQNLTRILFNSSMNSTDVNDIECYMLAVPAGTFPAADMVGADKAYVDERTAAAVAQAKKYTDSKATGGGGGGGGAAATPMVCSSQFYNVYRVPNEGGNGASLDGNAMHVNSEASHQVTFKANATVNTPVAGWYRVELQLMNGNDMTSGYWLNNNITKFPAVVGISTVAQTRMSGAKNYVAFLAKMEANTDYRICLSSYGHQTGTEGYFNGANATLTLSLVYPA